MENINEKINQEQDRIDLMDQKLDKQILQNEQDYAEHFLHKVDNFQLKLKNSELSNNQTKEKYLGQVLDFLKKIIEGEDFDILSKKFNELLDELTVTYDQSGKIEKKLIENDLRLQEDGLEFPELKIGQGLVQIQNNTNKQLIAVITKIDNPDPLNPKYFIQDHTNYKPNKNNENKFNIPLESKFYSLKEVRQIITDCQLTVTESSDVSSNRVQSQVEILNRERINLTNQLLSIDLSLSLRDPARKKEIFILTTLQNHKQELYNNLQNTLNKQTQWEDSTSFTGSITKGRLGILVDQILSGEFNLYKLNESPHKKELIKIVNQIKEVSQAIEDLLNNKKLQVKKNFLPDINYLELKDNPNAIHKLFLQNPGAQKDFLNWAQNIGGVMEGDVVLYSMKIFSEMDSNELQIKDELKSQTDYMQSTFKKGNHVEAAMVFSTITNKYLEFRVNGESFNRLNDGSISLTGAINKLIALGEIDNGDKPILSPEDLFDLFTNGQIAENYTAIIQLMDTSKYRGGIYPEEYQEKISEKLINNELDRITNIFNDKEIQGLQPSIEQAVDCYDKVEKPSQIKMIIKEIALIMDDPVTYAMLIAGMMTEGLGTAGYIGKIAEKAPALSKLMSSGKMSARVMKFILSSVVDGAVFHTGLNTFLELSNRGDEAHWGVGGFANSAALFGVGKIIGLAHGSLTQKAPGLMTKQSARIVETQFGEAVVKNTTQTLLNKGLYFAEEVLAFGGLGIIQNYLVTGDFDQAIKIMKHNFEFMTAMRFVHFAQNKMLLNKEMRYRALENQHLSDPKNQLLKEAWLKSYHDYIKSIKETQEGNFRKGMTAKREAIQSETLDSNTETTGTQAQSITAEEILPTSERKTSQAQSKTRQNIKEETAQKEVVGETIIPESQKKQSEQHSVEGEINPAIVKKENVSVSPDAETILKTLESETIPLKQRMELIWQLPGKTEVDRNIFKKQIQKVREIRDKMRHSVVEIIHLVEKSIEICQSENSPINRYFKAKNEKGELIDTKINELIDTLPSDVKQEVYNKLNNLQDILNHQAELQQKFNNGEISAKELVEQYFGFSPQGENFDVTISPISTDFNFGDFKDYIQAEGSHESIARRTGGFHQPTDRESIIAENSSEGRNEPTLLHEQMHAKNARIKTEKHEVRNKVYRQSINKINEIQSIPKENVDTHISRILFKELDHALEYWVKDEVLAYFEGNFKTSEMERAKKSLAERGPKALYDYSKEIRKNIIEEISKRTDVDVLKIQNHINQIMERYTQIMKNMFEVAYESQNIENLNILLITPYKEWYTKSEKFSKKDFKIQNITGSKKINHQENAERLAKASDLIQFNNKANSILKNDNQKLLEFEIKKEIIKSIRNNPEGVNKIELRNQLVSKMEQELAQSIDVLITAMQSGKDINTRQLKLMISRINNVRLRNKEIIENMIEVAFENIDNLSRLMDVNFQEWHEFSKIKHTEDFDCSEFIMEEVPNVKLDEMKYSRRHELSRKIKETLDDLIQQKWEYSIRMKISQKNLNSLEIQTEIVNHKYDINQTVESFQNEVLKTLKDRSDINIEGVKQLINERREQYLKITENIVNISYSIEDPVLFMRLMSMPVSKWQEILPSKYKNNNFNISKQPTLQEILFRLEDINLPLSERAKLVESLPNRTKSQKEIIGRERAKIIEIKKQSQEKISKIVGIIQESIEYCRENNSLEGFHEVNNYEFSKKIGEILKSLPDDINIKFNTKYDELLSCYESQLKSEENLNILQKANLMLSLFGENIEFFEPQLMSINTIKEALYTRVIFKTHEAYLQAFRLSRQENENPSPSFFMNKNGRNVIIEDGSITVPKKETPNWQEFIINRMFAEILQSDILN